MNTLKKLAGVTLALTMVMSLAACGGISEEKRMQNYVQGELDCSYLGQFNEDYLKELDMTEEEATESYQANLEGEADFFAQVFSIQDYVFDDEMKAEVVDLYKEIYAEAKYTVHEGSKMESGNYAVEVIVEPIDIINQITDDDVATAWDDVCAAHNITSQEEMEAVSDEEYTVMEEEYADTIIQMVREKLPTLDYEASKSVTVLIKDTGDYYEMDEDSWWNLDAAIVAYE